MSSNLIRVSSQSRREFLRRSAAAAAAVPALSIARLAHAAGSDVIRIGMIGCGGRCTGAAIDAMTADPATRLVAMTDPFLDRVKAKREVLSKAKPEQVRVDDDHCFCGLDGYRKVIESADYVLIACAAKFHPMDAKAAVEAGKHVFVEKPHRIDPWASRSCSKPPKLPRRRIWVFLSGLQSRFNAPHPRDHRSRARRPDWRHRGHRRELPPPLRGARTGPRTSANWSIQVGNQYRFAWLCGDDVPQSLVHNLDRAIR